MRTPTRVPFTVNRPELAAVVEPLVEAGYTPEAVSGWFRRERRELRMQGDEPLSPRGWLYAGGSTRKLVALARSDAAAHKRDQEALAHA